MRVQRGSNISEEFNQPSNGEWQVTEYNQKGRNESDKSSGATLILALIDFTTWHLEQLTGTTTNGALTQVRLTVGKKDLNLKF